MYKIFGIFALCLTIAQIGNAIDCYNCAPPAQCENVDRLTAIGCGNAAVPPMKPACQKITLKRKDATELSYLRRCVTVASEEDKSQCQAPLGFEMIECNICFEDSCNSGNSARLSFIAVVSIICALVFGRVILS